MNKLILAGGTGFIGKALVNYFKNQFSEVVILSRSSYTNHDNVRGVKWDGKTIGSWVSELENADVLINLSGKNINCRFTDQNKNEILESRVNATNALGQAVLHLKVPPKLWINFSAVAIYKSTIETTNTEYSKEQGIGFMYEVCKKWESAFNDFELHHTRKVTLRISVVLGKQGGMISKLLPLVKLFLGGKAGNGKQMISWIHEQDLCRIIDFLIHNNSTHGIYNAAAEFPVSNRAFMQTFRKVLGIPFGLPAPAFAVKLGAFLMGTESSLVLDSVNVKSEKLLNEGFQFKYQDIYSCLKSVLTK